jgi:hypothetical protein
LKEKETTAKEQPDVKEQVDIKEQKDIGEILAELFANAIVGAVVVASIGRRSVHRMRWCNCIHAQHWPA